MGGVQLVFTSTETSWIGNCIWPITGQKYDDAAYAFHCPVGFYSPNAERITSCDTPFTHFRGDGAYCARSAGSVDVPKSIGQCSDGTCGIGNPISISPILGNKYQAEVDYSRIAASPLELRRSYNSRDLPYDQTAYARQIVSPPRFGRNWRDSYDLSVYLTTTEPPSTSTATVQRPDGKVLAFTLTNGVWTPDSDISDKLSRLVDGSGNPTGWRFTRTRDDSIETYGIDGRLLSIQARTGVTQTLTYSDGSTPTSIAPVPGLLTRVTDSYGKQLNFTYNAASRVVSMTDPAGGTYTYTYGADQNLISVTYPDTRLRTYVYNEPANTSSISQPNALTGILDENNSRYATYKYDTQGRAYSTEHANGAEKYTIAYSAFPVVGRWCRG